MSSFDFLLVVTYHVNQERLDETQIWQDIRFALAFFPLFFLPAMLPFQMYQQKKQGKGNSNSNTVGTDLGGHLVQSPCSAGDLSMLSMKLSKWQCS